jgi:hypothetical protein
VTVDRPGNIFIADTLNNRIRKVDTSGVITTVAGTGNGGFGGDGGPAGAASLNLPRDVVVDSVGNLLIADTANNRIRKVDTSGVITTIAGTGNGGFGGDGGPATSANLSGPIGVNVDSAGNLLIADTGNNRIRKVDTGGTITTLAGMGTGAFSGDGGPATTASLNSPTSVAVGGAGIFYITDYSSNRIRKVDTSGVITTAAGTGGGNLNQLVGIDTATGAISEKLRLRTGVILLGAE